MPLLEGKRILVLGVSLVLVILLVGIALPKISLSLSSAFPRVVPTYYGKADVETVLANLGRGQDAIGVSACEVIRSYPDIPARAHGQGLIVVGDMALGNCVETWNTYDLSVVASLLVQAVQKGVDVISLDESGFASNIAWVNQLRSSLKVVNPQVQIMLTDTSWSALSFFVTNGGQVDAIALEWYSGGGPYFNSCINLANNYGIRCAYWVDATTAHYMSTTYTQAGTVLLWFATAGTGFWSWANMKQAIEANIPPPPQALFFVKDAGGNEVQIVRGGSVRVFSPVILKVSAQSSIVDWRALVDGISYPMTRGGSSAESIFSTTPIPLSAGPHNVRFEYQTTGSGWTPLAILTLEGTSEAVSSDITMPSVIGLAVFAVIVLVWRIRQKK